MAEYVTDSPNGQGGAVPHIEDVAELIPDWGIPAPITLGFNAEAEAELLACIVQEADATRQAESIQRHIPSDFDDFDHAAIFQSIQSAHGRRDEVCFLSIAEDLKAKAPHLIQRLADAIKGSAGSITAASGIVLDRAIKARAVEITDTAGLDIIGGKDVHQTLQALRAGLDAMEARRPRGKRLLRPSELAARPPLPHIIQNLLPARSIGIVYGASRSYKSFLTLDMALHIATGRPWHGRAVKHGPVVYVAAEAGDSYTERIQAWSNFYGVPLDELDNFLLLPEPVHVHKAEGITEMLATIRAELSELPAFIVFDTLARSMAGGDENAAKDASLLTEGGERLARETGASVLFVHHTGKNGEMRGSSGFLANFDYVMRAERVGQVVSLTREKTRGRGEDEQLGFAHRLVEVGPTPEDTSLVFVPTDIAPGKRELHPDAQMALAVLKRAGADGLTRATWRAGWDAARESAGVKSASPDAARKAWDRAKKALMALELAKEPSRDFFEIAQEEEPDGHGQ